MAAGIYCHSTTPVATPLVGTVQELEKQGCEKRWSRSCTLIAALACSIALLAFGPTPGSCTALRSPGVYSNVPREIVKDAWDAVEKAEIEGHLLGQTKAKSMRSQWK